MIIKAKSPTRVDLAGGTLDLWPIYVFLGGALTVNFSIDIFTRVKLSKLKKQVIINSIDLKKKWEFSSLDELLKTKNKQLDFYKSFLKFFPTTSNSFSLDTFSESPIGGGLGGSSSLLISMLKAFSQLEKNKVNKNTLVTIAGNIEANILQTPTGTQDYYPAIDGGLNIIHYNFDKIFCEKININFKYIEENSFLVYTGKPHHSGINNWDVLNKAVKKDKNTLKRLSNLKDIATQMAELCYADKWIKMSEILDKEFENRIHLSKKFVSPQIIKLKKIITKENKKNSIKICGAGGGGCVLVWLNKSTDKKSLMEECKKKFQVYDYMAVQK